MLSQLIIRTTEKETGASAAYLGLLRRLSGGLFWRLVLALGSLRTRAPHPQARAVASLVAIQSQDCGPCLEISVRFALRDGCSKELVGAVLHGNMEPLPPELQTVYRLAQAVYRHEPEVAELSELLEKQLGPKVRADVALTLAFTPIYPFLKRALGVATDRCLRPEALLEAVS